MSSTTPETGQQGQQEQEQQNPPANQPANQGGEPPKDDAGRGGKAAVLAELAGERDKRQALEQQIAAQGQRFEELMATLGKAFGFKSEELTPDQLKEQLTTAQQETQDTKTMLGVYQAAATLKADPSKLMDSVSVREKLKGVNPSDTAAISAVLSEAVKGNPHFLLTPPGAGAGDAGADGSSKPPAGSMNDWIRQAAGKS